MEINQETISRLKFIGKVKKGEKINTRYMYVQPDGIYTTFCRTFISHDNRINTLNFIHETILNSFRIFKEYESQKEFDENINSVKFKGECLFRDLDKSREGIINLKNTYNTDTKFCCDMDTILQHIETELLNYVNKYSDLCLSDRI